MQVENAEKLYHRADPWAGIRDYAEGRGAFPIRDPGDFSERVPLLGFYDEMSQATVDAQILQAASEGIEFFAIYWFIDANTGEELDVSAPTPNFFRSRYSDRMRFALAIIVKGMLGQNLPMSVWKKTVVPKLVDYMNQSSYFRSNGGRPLVIDFHIPFANPQESREAYAYLREAARQGGGSNPQIISLLGQRATRNDISYRLRVAGPDSFTCFSFGPSRPAEPYSEFAAAWADGLRRQLAWASPVGNAGYIPCGSIGIDARPWYGIGWTNYEGERNAEARPEVHPVLTGHRR